MVATTLASGSLARHHPVVLASVSSLPAIDDPAWSLAAATVGDSVAVTLADPSVLVDASDRLAELARTEGCDAIIGASSVGDHLAGAVAARFSVPLYDPTNPPKCLLVVDAVLATGAALSVAIDAARLSGVNNVRAAVLVDLGATHGLAGSVPVTQL